MISGTSSRCIVAWPLGKNPNLKFGFLRFWNFHFWNLHNFQNPHFEKCNFVFLFFLILFFQKIFFFSEKMVLLIRYARFPAMISSILVGPGWDTAQRTGSGLNGNETISLSEAETTFPQKINHLPNYSHRFRNIKISHFDQYRPERVAGWRRGALPGAWGSEKEHFEMILLTTLWFRPLRSVF